MNLRGILRPEYLLRPKNIFRRLFRGARPGRVVLPIGRTGGRIRVRGDEYLGLNLRTFGVYDLVLTETLYRLARAGAVAVDVGANIGYTAVLLGRRVGPDGRVVAFEPIPSLFDELVQNLLLNGLVPPTVRAVRAAASASPVTCRAKAETGAGNDGLFSLERPLGSGEEVEITCVRLDDAVAEFGRIDVLKVDVEGHEASVFAGAAGLLSGGRIRTVVYEDHHPHPSPAFRELSSHGMRLWRLETSFRGPRLRSPDCPSPETLEPNWVATLDPNSIEAALAPRGWTVF